MLTTRAWWFLVVVLSLLTLAVFDPADRQTLVLVSLSLFFWFCGEWLLFVVRVRLVVPELRVFRELRDERGSVQTLWAGYPFQMHVELRSAHWLGLPYVLITERVPFNIEVTRGQTQREGTLGSRGRLGLSYALRAPGAGIVRFDGLRVELADFQGFFYHVAFVAQPKLHSVLPPLADAAGHRPTIKRHNLLPSPGVHRHLRPGSGSELLDLRDYLPGDPPKTIAWKVSARRDRLITKVFESEVPLRCTIFLDTSHSVRIGPPGSNALARLVEIAAAVSQATSAARDLTGLCVLDDRGVATLLRPARGAKHLVRLLHVLANAAALAPATGQAQANLLVPLAYGLAQEVYPTLLTPDVNAVPGWLGWLWPVPGNQPPPRPLRRIAGWLGLLIAGLPAIVSLWLIYTFRDLLLPFAQIFLPLPGGLLETVALSAMAVGIGLYFGVLHLIPRILPLSVAARRRRLTRWRKALAAILAERYGMVPGGLARLLEDDEEFLALLQRFLAEHQIPYPLPYYDAEGRYLFASPGKIPVLARAILQSVGKGHDNELFVLLVDLLELSEDLDPFLCAVKVARARHHQLMVVCPWPPGMPPPGTHPPVAGGTKPLAAAHLQEQLQNLTTRRLQEAFDRLRRTLARLGVPVICAQSGDPVQLILNRLDRLRSIGQGRWR